MNDTQLYDEIHKHVREINSLFRKYNKERNPTKARAGQNHEHDGVPDTHLLERCAIAFGTSVKEIMSNSKRQNLAAARQLYCYIRHHHYGISPGQVGAELGRHRTTVIHSIKTASDLLEVDKSFRKKYSEIVNT
jgi:chromosomal replication initiation ATPase DnaA